ncbi:MAG TPA: dipeptidase [Negativicutes bacterium]|nr:dipeptidase [Negativicutes bacterium]
MQIIDLHCDTISCLMAAGDSAGLRRNNLSIDVEKLVAGQARAEFFALYVDREDHSDPLAYCLLMLDRFYQELAQNADTLQYAGSYEDLARAAKQQKIAAFLAVEEGGVLQGNPANLRILYRLGVRLLTLTWNYPNEIGFPNKTEAYRQAGLTDFGREVVREMNRLGMIIDVSHLSDGGFYDVARLSTKPFVASHSNARSITDHPRNLTDDMIRVIADTGGIIGLNFAAPFLGTAPVSQISDMVRHLNHLRKTGGADVLAMGTDFDGIERKLEIDNMGEIGKLTDALRKARWTPSEIEKLFYRNALRLIKDVLG